MIMEDNGFKKRLLIGSAIVLVVGIILGVVGGIMTGWNPVVWVHTVYFHITIVAAIAFVFGLISITGFYYVRYGEWLWKKKK